MKLVFHPGGRTVEVGEGTTLMEAARSAGLALENQCGGAGHLRQLQGAGPAGTG